MANVFASGESRGRIIRNENALLPDFAPAELLHRGAQIQEIARAIKPLVSGQKPSNLFIFGPTGTGKTSSVKSVFSQLGEYSQKVSCVYINCWEHSSKQAVLSKLAQSFGEALPRRGLAADEVFSRVMQRAKYEGKSVAVALDEADRLFSREGESIIYDISRAHENYGIHCALIAISNNYELPSRLDDRSRSSLSLHALEFPQYSPMQLKDILRERGRAAFFPGTCPEEAIALCAGHGAKARGDARVAINALLEAARAAESRASASIGLEDARRAVEASSAVSLKKNLSLMSANERLLFSILESAKSAGAQITSGELYSRYNEAATAAGGEPLSERQLRNYLESFERARMVTVREAGLGDKGRTRVVSLR